MSPAKGGGLGPCVTAPCRGLAAGGDYWKVYSSALANGRIIGSTADDTNEAVPRPAVNWFQAQPSLVKAPAKAGAAPTVQAINVKLLSAGGQLGVSWR